MFVGEVQAKHWMKITNWENLESSLELQPVEPCNLLYNQAWAITRQFIEQFPGFFQTLLIGTKFRFANKNLMNLYMTITIDFRLFLKKILVFLQMLILPR